ncbi:hypothetical protein HK099_004325 [Clydaea vesicula]|uniref:SET domain-containing protein n=1 Tax=Clydaea vesicula TaxID=447962 RepID=A0AAD5U703_9FUNG|nr:hypothetical protein HK099_004325 [Clydaea vesicula]
MLIDQTSPSTAESFKKFAQTDSPKHDYPTEVVSVSYGKALIAKKDVLPGTVLEKFIGPDVDYEKLSDFDKCYALNYFSDIKNDWVWLLAENNARFANHSCNPNSIINKNQEIVAKKFIKSGEEITFIYNIGEDSDYW